MSIENRSAAILKLIKLHFLSIKNESIKPVQYKQKIKDKFQTFSTWQDHSCYSAIDIYIGMKKVSKSIDDYCLDTQFINHFNNPKIKHNNINYAYNQHTYLKKLKDVIQKEIPQLTFIKI